VVVCYVEFPRAEDVQGVGGVEEGMAECLCVCCGVREEIEAEDFEYGAREAGVIYDVEG
jgi:hypothetical protein